MKTTAELRQRPNILITGTPCTGKTTLAKRLADINRLHYIDVNEAILKFKLHSGYDEVYKSFVLDEDRFLDHLEEYFDDLHSNGGLIIDYHSCDFFPVRWFDHVIVLRCDNDIIYDRLHARESYTEAKRAENLECEIMGVIAEEAHDAYPVEGVVCELLNNSDIDFQTNLDYICKLISEFKKCS